MWLLPGWRAESVTFAFSSTLAYDVHTRHDVSLFVLCCQPATVLPRLQCTAKAGLGDPRRSSRVHSATIAPESPETGIYSKPPIIELNYRVTHGARAHSLPPRASVPFIPFASFRPSPIVNCNMQQKKTAGRTSGAAGYSFLMVCLAPSIFPTSLSSPKRSTSELALAQALRAPPETRAPARASPRSSTPPMAPETKTLWAQRSCGKTV